ncbi:hypothetical protein [Mycobacterium sp. NPDC050853]|uniref:hypothetical protein n=1 Tax=Mycobacteriaceae TaxID=1762 RepID=UPI0015DEB28B|nr:hypothetical protein [Mycobacteroides sp. LB1]
MAGRTVDQLKVDYPDVDWREKFIEFCGLMEALADCIISDNYVVSDELNAAIKLSEAGNKLMGRLLRQKVNAKDARLMCALTLGHDEIFVDIDATDIIKLSEAIDAGIKKGAIRFPFIYGREFYDTYAEMFDDEREFLSNEETLRLLEKLPSGVFQYGVFTIGPYGVCQSSEPRKISASRRVPGYHCSVPACLAIHPVSLQTGSNASINRDRVKLEDALQNMPADASDWWQYAAELSGGASTRYGDQQIAVLLPLVGDTLSDGELRSLVSNLFDNTKGQLREAVSPFLNVGDARSCVEALGRAELLQIVLLAREEPIACALDRLVRAGDIKVPRGDVRRPVVNRNVRSGAFRLHAELGHYGVRFVSDDPGLALLRERRLLNKLYVREPGTDVQELEWQLRGIDIEDLDEKLEHFYQTKAPTEALRRLVLARKSNAVTACHEVGVDHDEGLTDTALIETLLWKLGFPIESDEDPHKSFWERHERLWALTQSLTVASSSERFQETAMPYFTILEGLLLDSLAFTSWALLVDHTRTDMPFTYDNSDDREAGLALLQSAWVIESAGGTYDIDYTGSRVDLRALMDGFRVLAKHLDRCRVTPELYERPAAEIPEFDGKTELKRYLLRSTLPFLDLSRPSQDRIIESLEQISQSMAKAEVNQVRNDYMHYRRIAPNVTRIENALEATRQSVSKIENMGFCRLMFSPAAVVQDRWGQRIHEFIGPRSYEHFFARPTTLDWMGLPRLVEAQYLLRAASFGDPNEVLRFTPRYPSEFSEIWQGFPNRRRRGPGSLAAEDAPAHKSDVQASR